MSTKTRSRLALRATLSLIFLSSVSAINASPLSDPQLRQAAEALGVISIAPAQRQIQPNTQNSRANFYALKRQQQLRENEARKRERLARLQRLSLQRQQRSQQTSHNPNVWQRVYRGFRFQNQNHQPLVRRFINEFSRHPASIERKTDRAKKYLFHIVNELEQRRMPMELALLPFIESAYKNTAFSHAGAAGMWQFIPSTGRNYGLKQTVSYDARLDTFEATRAALDYLQKLHREFRGDWLLALAAYNAGENRVHREISYNRSKGRRTDYWSLNLPRETRQYVPKLLAVKEILRNPRHYRVNLRAVPNTPQITQIRVNKPVNLKKVAAQAGLPTHTLASLNPSYLHGITTPRFSNRIILPRQHAGRINHIINRLPPAADVHKKPAYRLTTKSKRYKKRYSKRSKGRRYITHKVKRGDNLFRIALKHGTTVQKIKKLNNLKSNKIKPGKRLKIASQKGRSYRRHS